jgi:hypothetical protein
MRHLSLPLCLIALCCAAPAFAEDVTDAGPTDAGSTDVAPSQDATALTDTVSDADTVVPVQPDATSTVDAGPVDSGPTDATPTTDTTTDTTKPDTSGSFNENPCWDSKCAKETDACKANAQCVELVSCIKTSNQACIQKLANTDGSKLYKALQNCAYKACADPTKGSCKGQCGKFLGNNAPCNCDTECKQYGDCCADYDELCAKPAAGSCAGVDCSKPDAKGNGGNCYCDDACVQNKDCCPDKDTACKATPACKPVCDKKNCGDDDGCGNKCPGACPAGETCTPKGCVNLTPGADTASGTDTAAASDTGTSGDSAGSGGGDSASGGGDSAGTADAGGVQDSGGKSTTTPAPAPPAASSGCTASTAPVARGGWWLVVALIASAFVVRRRVA